MRRLSRSAWILIISSVLLVGGIAWAFASGHAKVEFELIEPIDAAG